MRRPFNSNDIITVINPVILRGEGHSVKTENCFSIDALPSNVRGARVKRMSRIFVNYTSVDGTHYEEEQLVGIDARVFQHELDHLNGELMLDEGTKYGKFMGWDRT
jgi:peptide deformylase